jgi:hypothetical protein
MKSLWTPERRAQQSEAIHRWRPWTKSTGPKTAKGKAIVARNAFNGGKRPELRQHLQEVRCQLRAAIVILDCCRTTADLD